MWNIYLEKVNLKEYIFVLIFKVVIVEEKINCLKKVMLCMCCLYMGGDYWFCWIIFDIIIFVKFGGWLSFIYD